MPNLEIDDRAAPPLRRLGAADLNWAVLDYHFARIYPVNERDKKQNKEPVMKKDEDVVYKVKDYVARRSVNGDFGIEIEVEGENLFLPDGENDPYWGFKNDGSLRGGGVEYVFKKPLSLDKTKEALSYIAKSSREGFVFSFRTSVHVHVNVLEMTRPGLFSFLYLSHLLEDALVKYSGESREGNRFCLRMKDAEWKIEALKAFFSSKGGLWRFSEEEMKYSAINLAAIYRFGSIEFRSMRGTLDTEVLFPWIDVLYRIRDFAIHNSVQDINNAIRLNPVGTAIEVFGEHFDKFNYPGLEKDIKEAHCRLIELPYIKGA